MGLTTKVSILKFECGVEAQRDPMHEEECAESPVSDGVVTK